MKRTVMKYMLGLAVFVAILATGMPAVYALEGESPESKPTELKPEQRSGGQTPEDSKERRASGAQSQQENRRTAVKDKLADKRLQTCQSRQDQIKTIMKRTAQRGQRHIDQFMTIAERVEAFYVKRGKPLAGYDQLVAAISAKKATAEAAIQAVQAAGENFSCSSDSPKADLQDFKSKVRAAEAAMKELRTAVKNLIVGVKSVQGTTESAKAEETQ